MTVTGLYNLTVTQRSICNQLQDVQKKLWEQDIPTNEELDKLVEARKLLKRIGHPYWMEVSAAIKCVNEVLLKQLTPKQVTHNVKEVINKIQLVIDDLYILIRIAKSTLKEMIDSI
ncbi:MAG: hypothetical protein NC218_01830 [Acetobacter sp.]|nr:hypothetical protein [Acetobacter sp.]